MTELQGLVDKEGLPPETKAQAVDLTSDTFGLFLMRLVQVSDSSWGGSWKKKLLKTVHTVLVYLTSVSLQFVLSGVLYMKADKLEARVENRRFVRDFNMSIADASSMLIDAAGDNETLNTADCKGILGECKYQLHMQVYGMYPAMIFVWFAILIQEFHLVGDWCFHLYRMRVSQEESGFIQEDADGKGSAIKELTRCHKVILVLFCPFVRLLIALLVGYAGAKFLLMQAHDLSVILKALAMKFVLDLDDFLLQGFTTPNVRKELSKTRLEYERKDSMKTGELAWWNSGIGGIFFLFLDAVLVYLVYAVVFHDLRDFRYACRTYHEKFPLLHHGPIDSMWTAWQDVVD